MKSRHTLPQQRCQENTLRNSIIIVCYKSYIPNVLTIHCCVVHVSHSKLPHNIIHQISTKRSTRAVDSCVAEFMGQLASPLMMLKAISIILA